jgi:[acyl-carrier-protein] S-malonyltransferase
MHPAQERLARDLDALEFRDLDLPLVNNVDAAPVRAGGDVRAGLVRQVSGAVRWLEVVERLRAEGVTTFVEVGPGTVLAGLVNRITGRQVRMLNVEDPASLARTLTALREAA